MMIATGAVQGQTLSGRVVDCVAGQPLAGVSVKIAGSTGGTSTGSEGAYQFANLREGTYRLEFSFIGMKTVRREVRLAGSRNETLNICMEEEVSTLGEVTVEARYERKEMKEAREQGVPVSVIDGKLLAGRGTSIAEVINHQTGVKVRRTGGASSDTKINVRGLEGNRVQIYLDGYALNTPDGSFSINDIPLQFIDRIEIYKGIVPPEFGGDGLGSAINIVTIDAQGSYYDAWYGAKSYGGHEGSLLYKHYFPKTKLYSAVMIGGEHSLNNYSMQSPYTPGLTIRRDHDRFRKLDGAVTFEFKEAYFDEFEIENVFYANDREIQGIQANIRHARTSGWIVGTTPKLEKSGFLTEKLDMKFLGTALCGVTRLNDTSSYTYDFYGGRFLNTYRGEVGSVPNLSDDRMQDYRYNLNLKYRLLPDMAVNLNNDFRFVHTETRDTLADRYLNTHYSGFTTGITTLISSLNLENKWFNRRVTTLLTGRHYFYGVHGKTVDLSYGTNAMPDEANEQQHYFGYSLAIKYDFARSWLLKLALEHNYRLPRSEELLGDRVRLIPNTKLRPEQANNGNLGMMFDRYYDSFRRLQMEANVYVMSVNDMMMTRSANYYMGYYNVGKALLWGADMEVKWDVSREWFLMLNATYQKAIDKARYVPGSNTPSVTYGLQIPHIPVFFANWSADYRRDNLFGGRGQYSRFYYEGGYTGKYYYGYNLTASRNFVIPSSCIHTVGAEYAILDRRVLFSIECHNLFNSKELTNLNYPLAGRTMQAKVRFTSMKW
ncbi:MAG: carboxypeptidase-like regulatory domain-containing protein [Tannerella sp.]|jgi:outer membrane receptor protein involved in Fe transport|nr:carboxypeptidase-like regulatory domain-containing protein [Tannerella sp.]